LLYFSGMKHFLMLALLCLLVACDETSKDETAELVINQALSEQLTGEWVNTRLSIVMPGYRNSDSAYTVTFNEQQWEQEMGLRPVKTRFRKNGRYSQIHATLGDSLLQCPAGRWMVIADTLHMQDTFPALGQVYKYKLEIRNDTAWWWGQEDSDGDGKRDDSYSAVLRRSGR